MGNWLLGDDSQARPGPPFHKRRAWCWTSTPETVKGSPQSRLFSRSLCGGPISGPSASSEISLPTAGEWIGLGGRQTKGVARARRVFLNGWPWVRPEGETLWGWPPSTLSTSGGIPREKEEFGWADNSARVVRDEDDGLERRKDDGTVAGAAALDIYIPAGGAVCEILAPLTQSSPPTAYLPFY